MVPIRMRRRRPFVRILVLGAVLIVPVLAVIGVVGWNLVRDDVTLYKLSDLGLLMGIVAAVIGWLVAGHLQLRSGMKQHSINLLFQTRFTNDIFAKHRQSILEKYPNYEYSRITMEEMQKLKSSSIEADRKAAEAITYMMNYYEFIAAGIRHGDLDMALMRDTIRGNLVDTFKLCRPFIKEVSRGNSKLEHMKALYREWSYED